MNDRVALVTGASSGIGERSAVLLQRKGFRVYGVARRADRLASLTADGVEVFEMDVTDDASMRAGIDRILQQHSRLDVLVNNAGYGSLGAVEQVAPEEARRQFDVNLFGPARLIQLVTPVMREQGSGRIVNVSSIVGRITSPFGAWYQASKFALEGLSDSLRIELSPFGIDVVLVEPGAVRTEWGAIAREHLSASSADGPYAKHVAAVVKMFERSDSSTLFSTTADVVAQTIVKAATTGKPRARYPVGPGAGLMITARRFTPDVLWDGALRRFAI